MRWRALLLSALSAAALGALPSHPAAAVAAMSVRLDGPGFAGLNVDIAADPELFSELLAQVAWLANRPGDAPAPPVEALGPGYRLVVSVDGTPHQTYDLYPLAVGGPRVFRPAAQPNRPVAAAWFYGRLSMPDVLARAGVPLPPSIAARPIADGRDGRWVANGRGGQAAGDAPGAWEGTEVVAEPGEPAVVPVTPTAAPVAGMDDVLRQWRHSMLLVGAGGLVLLLLLGAVALLTHDR